MDEKVLWEKGMVLAIPKMTLGSGGAHLSFLQPRFGKKGKVGNQVGPFHVWR